MDKIPGGAIGTIFFLHNEQFGEFSHVCIADIFFRFFFLEGKSIKLTVREMALVSECPEHTKITY